MIYKNDQDIVPMEIDRREEKGIWLVIGPKRMKPLYNRVSLFRWKPDVFASDTEIKTFEMHG